MEIADLNLSVRTFNAVCRAGIKTIPELHERYQTDREWMQQNIGRKATAEIGDALAKHRDAVFAEIRRAERKTANPPHSGSNNKEETYHGKTEDSSPSISVHSP